jgi:hypothetical protein
MEGQTPAPAPLGDLSNVATRMMSPETPAGKPVPGQDAAAAGPEGVARKHSPWTAARNKKKTKNVLLSDDDDPMPSACFSSPGAARRARARARAASAPGQQRGGALATRRRPGAPTAGRGLGRLLPPQPI